MSHPWFSDPAGFGMWYGTLVGGVGGTLCGLLGAAAGTLAPRGKGRSWVMGGVRAFLLFGVLNLVLGLAALLTRQNFGIWSALLLGGAIFTLVMAAGLPALNRAYDQAEERRFDAQAIRQS